MSVAFLQHEVQERLEALERQIRHTARSLDQVQGTSKALAKGLRRLRYRHVTLSPVQPCGLCGRPLVASDWLLFPTGSGYHRDCLSDSVLPTLGPSLASQADALLRSGNATSAHAMKRNVERWAQLVAPEDIACGEHMVSSIVEDFPPPLGRSASIGDDDWCV